MPGGVLTGQDAGSGRGADRTGIGIRELHTPFGKTLDVGCLVKGCLSIKGGIRPAQVVREYQDQVFCRLRRANREK